MITINGKQLQIYSWRSLGKKIFQTNKEKEEDNSDLWKNGKGTKFWKGEN